MSTGYILYVDNFLLLWMHCCSEILFFKCLFSWFQIVLICFLLMSYHFDKTEKTNGLNYNIEYIIVLMKKVCTFKD